MGILRKNLADLEDNGKVGDWSFLENKDELHMFLRYPRVEQEIYGDEARGEIVHLPIKLGESVATPVFWGWDGNKESPTISPSINVIGQWHGWFRNGKLETV